MPDLMIFVLGVLFGGGFCLGSILVFRWVAGSKPATEQPDVPRRHKPPPGVNIREA